MSEIIEGHCRRNPSYATYLGLHEYDDRLENRARATIEADVARLRGFRQRLDQIDPATLSEDQRLDRVFLQHQIDGDILELDVVRPWMKDADSYTLAATFSVYVIMKRAYAPPDQRLRSVIAREQQIPDLLAQARANLQNPPRIFTEIAIEQLDGNRSFFENDLPLAFSEVDDPALVSEFEAANRAVISALGDYKAWLQAELLPRSNGSFALGADTYERLLMAREMVDVPLDRLLAMAEEDRKRNEAAFVATARRIDPSRSAEDVLRDVQARHPPAPALLETTQGALDSLRQFVIDEQIVTIPESAPVQVQETPPFMRSTTSASMDTPGPFETTATEAYYNMTLPDARWGQSEQADFMRQWYHASISNVSVHEVYPGHYVQFLYAKRFPTLARKVFGASTSIEGWAHYCEQMMLDQGLHHDDPSYRLAQLQDALLRDVRFIVGIELHTRGLTIDQAQARFETQGHQPSAVALSEAKRGAGDPLYGYYTMGKLAILKLRDDVEALEGPGFSLRGFHDAFIEVGPLPLPLVREKLGVHGSLF